MILEKYNLISFIIGEGTLAGEPTKEELIPKAEAFYVKYIIEKRSHE